MNITRVVLIFWGGLYLILGPLRSPGDGDLYWQRWLGDVILQTHRLPNALGPETFTAAGASWVPQEWLFSIGVAGAHDWGVFLLFAGIVSLLPLGILLSIAARARGEAPSQAVGIALVFTGMALAEFFGIRAQVVGWFCFAWLLYFVERRDAWRYAAIAVTLVWANVHASVMLAPLIIVARMVGFSFDRRWREIAAQLPLLAGVALAICCTPLGLRLPQYAMMLAHSPIRHFIQEWQPAKLSDPALLYGALPLALAIVAGPAVLARHKPQAVVATLLFAAMLFAGRNTPLFAIAAAPLAAAGLAMRLPSIAAVLARRRDLEYVALPAIVAVLICSAVMVARNQAVGPSPLPVAAIAQLARDGNDHRVFCEDFTWCSVALQYPALRVFIDGRCDPYPLPVWQRYVEVLRNRPSSRAILASYDVDAVIANRDGALARALNGSPWHIALTNRAYVLFRRE